MKGDARKGGVGYEGGIITGEMLELGNHEKFIPLLRSGAWTPVLFGWRVPRIWISITIRGIGLFTFLTRSSACLKMLHRWDTESSSSPNCGGYPSNAPKGMDSVEVWTSSYGFGSGSSIQ